MADSAFAPDRHSVPVSDAELRQATIADVGRLKEVLAEAFHEDPILSWLIPDARRRKARLRRFFAVELRHVSLPRGQVWMTVERTGVAMTLRPGSWRVPLRATLLEGRCFGARLGMAARLGFAMEWHHARQVSRPHYYIRDVGVLPEMQGSGLGRALIGPTLERCDRHGLPAYLEASSERSAALYERLGFRLLRELQVGDSPPLWLMLRPPSPCEASP
jgi:ribosomal protein S18 acetylase RimI-like enzyme